MAFKSGVRDKTELFSKLAEMNVEAIMFGLHSLRSGGISVTAYMHVKKRCSKGMVDVIEKKPKMVMYKAVYSNTRYLGSKKKIHVQYNILY